MKSFISCGRVLRFVLAGGLACFAAAPVTVAHEEAEAAKAVDPKAAELLEKMSAAYRKLDALEVAGNVSIDFDVDGRKNQRTDAFSGSFAAPNRFRHESKAGTQLGSTGEKVYVYRAEQNTYHVTSDPLKPERFADLPNFARVTLFVANPSICMAVFADPMEPLAGTGVKRVDDAMIDGKPYPVLRVSGHASADVMTLVVDPATHLLRRVTFDSRKQFTFPGETEPKSAETVFDYTTVRPGAAFKPGQFAWSPPEGAVDAAAAGAGKAPRDAAALLEGKPAPALALKDLKGVRVTLAELKGSVVVLDFWATWCAPCVASLPALDAFAKKHGDAGVKVFAVNIKEDKEGVGQFVSDRKLSLSVLLDSDGAAALSYKAQAIPQTVVIGKDGVVRKVFVGAGIERALAREVEAALKAK